MGLLTTNAVAERLGVHPNTVLRWTAAGILPGFRLPGRALRFREDAIEAWLSERATGNGCQSLSGALESVE